MRIPRVILSREQEASVPKPEGRPPLAVGSRGGCRNVTFMWYMIAHLPVCLPQRGRGTAIAVDEESPSMYNVRSNPVGTGILNGPFPTEFHRTPLCAHTPPWVILSVVFPIF